MSVANSNEFVENGAQYLFYAVLDGYTPKGTTGTIANGSSAGMGRLRGVDTIDIGEPDAPRVYAVGDNGVISAFINQPPTMPGGNLTLGVFNQNFVTKSNGTKIFTIGDWDLALGFPLCFSLADQLLIINAPANSEESSSLDEGGWACSMVLKAQIQGKSSNQIQTAAPRKYGNVLSLKRSTYAPWGLAFSSATHGSTAGAFLGPFMSPYPIKMHTFIGDNSTVTFTLDETPAAANSTAVYLTQAGTALVYGAGAGKYVVDTSTRVVTMGTAPGAGVIVTVLYEFIPGC